MNLRQQDSMHSMEEILEWIEGRNRTLDVSLKKISLEECTPWFYDREQGCIRNESNSFFKVVGVRQYRNDEVLLEQPIIEQNEIGFLGIISCKINGEWHYLMQAKIEPGNVNVVQLSPTLQATKSNFTRKHGGKAPLFLEYFTDMKPEDVVVDQIQSEQSSRFMKKRNRNVILMVHEQLEEPDSHRWMTLSQIKELMHHENLVNMDTRTVLSCIPYVLMGQDGDVPFKDKTVFSKTAASMNRRTIVEMYREINHYKMFSDVRTEIVPLHEMENWHMKDMALQCKSDYPFQVIFCDISIQGREVSSWRQPLFAANGKALLGLFCCIDDGMLKFLVKMRPEVGAFDGIEIGPTVQKEVFDCSEDDVVETLFKQKLAVGDGIMYNCILSEEGGRFYQEENRNVIIKIDKDELGQVPGGYVWSDYGTLNILTQVNNCLNIQLRNLLSLLVV